jgi:hypothetical protein
VYLYACCWLATFSGVSVWLRNIFRVDAHTSLTGGVGVPVLGACFLWGWGYRLGMATSKSGKGVNPGPGFSVPVVKGKPSNGGRVGPSVVHPTEHPAATSKHGSKPVPGSVC